MWSLTCSPLQPVSLQFSLTYTREDSSLALAYQTKACANQPGSFSSFNLQTTHTHRFAAKLLRLGPAVHRHFGDDEPTSFGPRSELVESSHSRPRGLARHFLVFSLASMCGSALTVPVFAMTWLGSLREATPVLRPVPAITNASTSIGLQLLAAAAATTTDDDHNNHHHCDHCRPDCLPIYRRIQLQTASGILTSATSSGLL